MAEQGRHGGGGVWRKWVARWLASREPLHAAQGAAPAPRTTTFGANEKTIPIVRRRPANAPAHDTVTPSIIEQHCPLCGADMAFRVAPGGGGRAHLRCTRHPHCSGTREA